jgi:hypothetical protein
MEWPWPRNPLRPIQRPGTLSDIVLDACLVWYAVDPQSEGTRAPYMLELVAHAADREFYRRAILNRFRPQAMTGTASNAFVWCRTSPWRAMQRRDRRCKTASPQVPGSRGIGCDFTRPGGIRAGSRDQPPALLRRGGSWEGSGAGCVADSRPLRPDSARPPRQRGAACGSEVPKFARTPILELLGRVGPPERSRPRS